MEQLPYSTLVPGEVANSGNKKYSHEDRMVVRFYLDLNKYRRYW